MMKKLLAFDSVGEYQAWVKDNKNVKHIVFVVIPPYRLYIKVT